MSSNTKGNAREKAAVAILESQGWLCWRAGKVLAWVNGQPRSQQHDIFGCADIIAIKSGEPVRLIQVGSVTDRAAKQRKMRPVTDVVAGSQEGSPFDYDCINAEVWAWVGGRRPTGQRFRVRIYNGREWADCEDQVCVVESKRARSA